MGVWELSSHIMFLQEFTSFFVPIVVVIWLHQSYLIILSPMSFSTSWLANHNNYNLFHNCSKNKKETIISIKWISHKPTPHLTSILSHYFSQLLLHCWLRHSKLFLNLHCSHHKHEGCFWWLNFFSTLKMFKILYFISSMLVFNCIIYTIL